MTTTATWDSLHLFSHQGQDAFDGLLLDVVAPVMRAAAERRAVGAWFFIRYWEGGPHLRIRFRDADSEVAEGIRATLAEAAAARTDAAATLDPVEYYRRIGRDESSLRTYGWHADGTVERIPYVPEVDRYGGPAGIELSEEFFARSTDAALAAIRLSGTRAKRLAVALDALLTTASGLGLTSVGAAAWLRDYVAFWSVSQSQGLEQPAKIRAEAEREFLNKERSLIDRLDRLTGECATANPRSSFIGFWHAEVRACMERYRTAADAGRLSRPPLDLMMSQLHMFQNRLGLSVGDECYLAWLASLIFARRHVTGAYHADGPEEADRVYHEKSKYFPTRILEQKPDRTKKPERARLMRLSPRPVPLPPCDDPGELAAPLGATLLQRRTERALCGPLSLVELARLLRYAAGASGSKRIDNVPGVDAFDAPLRTYPSPSARFPVRLLVYAPGVEELERAVYAYAPETHTLERVGDAPTAEALLRSSPLTQAEQHAPIDGRQTPLWLFLVADFWYLRDVYGARAYRFLNLECGHLAQNIALVATAQRLSSIPLGGFYDDAVNQLLFIDGVTQSAMYVVLVGRIAHEPV